MRPFALLALVALGVGCSSGRLDWSEKRFAEDQELENLWGRGDELFAVGVSGAVDMSKDGGHSWSRRSVRPPLGEQPPTLWAVSGAGPKRLFAVGSQGVVYRSDDGGDDWLLSSVLSNRSLHAIAADAGSTVAVAGEKGTLFVSHDTGDSWEARDAGTSHDLRAVWMRTREEWFAVGGVSAIEDEPVGVITRSTDGGATWKAVEIGTSSLSAIAESDGKLFVAGSGGTVLRSDDGGASWNAVAVPTTVGLERIVASDHRLVLVGGIPDHGTILESNDDGASFHVDVAKGPGMAGLWLTPSGSWCAMGHDTTFYSAVD
jgi:photosystem II stability/assembly factor-like uncharacterized protein